jgi:hypothetical protein
MSFDLLSIQQPWMKGLDMDIHDVFVWIRARHSSSWTQIWFAGMEHKRKACFALIMGVKLVAE